MKHRGWEILGYVLREMTDFSYPAIGREFGDRAEIPAPDLTPAVR